jgi:hypothetical protein
MNHRTLWVALVITGAVIGCGGSGGFDDGRTEGALRTTSDGAFVLSLGTETNGQNSVSVQSSDGTPTRECVGGCDFAYLAGSTLTLLVDNPTDVANCLRFSAWDGACAGQKNPCTIVLNSDLSTNALWSRITHCIPR